MLVYRYTVCVYTVYCAAGLTTYLYGQALAELSDRLTTSRWGSIIGKCIKTDGGTHCESMVNHLILKGYTAVKQFAELIHL